MNERDDKHSFDPKHRIVGAVILVALAVIFLPMILNKTPEPPAVETIGEIPSPDNKVVVAPVPPLAATPIAPAQEPVSSAVTESAPPTPPTQDTPAKKIDKPAVKDKPTAKIEKGWVVQAGAFSSNENATQLRDKLRKKGFSAEIDKLTVDAKPMLRVRVGPYRDHAAAKVALTRMQNETGVQGVVLTYP